MAEQIDWSAQRTRLMEQGVLMMDPASVFVEPSVTVGSGTLLLPGVILRGTTVVGTGCELGPNTMVVNSTIGDNVVMNSSQCNESTVCDGANIGPFAYIRPHCTVGPNAKIGDFVELKNATIGAGTKVPHLTYVGDAQIGEKCNLGCGTITVNYDGKVKTPTIVGDGVFVGCNANLVAPVTVGDGAYIAAGSTITHDVPADSLAVARARPVIKLDWAAKRRTKK